MHYDLIELCAGTAAVSLAALGAPRFPASRIGSKAGYVDSILAQFGIQPGEIETALLVENDPRIARIHRALFGPDCAAMADEIEAQLQLPARLVWSNAKTGRRASDDLLWVAGARGGIGGFKGRHRLRKNVDGFIPSRLSLVKRVRNFIGMTGRAVVQQGDVVDIDPADFRPTKVYIDPPYSGRQGYGYELSLSIETLARRWADHGHLVVVSECYALPGATAAMEITHKRGGQARKSLTRSEREWISIYERKVPRNVYAA